MRGGWVVSLPKQHGWAPDWEIIKLLFKFGLPTGFQGIAMNIGGEDFALDMNAEPDGEVLLHPKQRMIIAARAAGVMPLGFIGTVADFSDWDKFRAMVRRARRFGFDGAACVHPGQVKIVNEEYTPGDEEVAYARKVIQMDRDAAAATARRRGRSEASQRFARRNAASACSAVTVPRGSPRSSAGGRSAPSRSSRSPSGCMAACSRTAGSRRSTSPTVRSRHCAGSRSR